MPNRIGRGDYRPIWAHVGRPATPPPEDDPVHILGEALTCAAANDRIEVVDCLLDAAVPIDTAPYRGIVSGSSTVYPIVLRQAEEFAQVAPGVAIAVEGPGSGDGAKKFCAGDGPIANASRLFKDEEIAICEENGIEFIELRRGIDGISVITSRFVEWLTEQAATSA